MPPSALIMSIIEQAREPLHCLHGAGYFTEDEWIQLDLIMNKKFLWTEGPKQLTQTTTKSTVHNKKSYAPMITKNVSQAQAGSGGERTSSSAEERSICTSVDPLSDDIETQATFTDTQWELFPAMSSPAPSKLDSKDPAEQPNDSAINGLASGYTVAQIEDARSLNANFTNRTLRDSFADRFAESLQSRGKVNSNPLPIRHKSVSSWASEVYNCPRTKSDALPASVASKISTDIYENLTRGFTHKPNKIIENSRLNDVNAFETSNAAEWDDIPSGQQNSLESKDISTLIDDKLQTIVETNNQDQLYEKKDSLSSSVTSHFNEEHTSHRPELVTRPPLRRREFKRPTDMKDSIYANPLPKTKTCWFWAESVSGCRYKPEECLNLHVKPKPGISPSYPIKDGKITWGSLADLAPQEVPIGKRPRSCWFWATRGFCDKGDSCEYVHGWVAGGVATRPRNLDYIYKRPDGPEFIGDIKYIDEEKTEPQARDNVSED